MGDRFAGERDDDIKRHMESGKDMGTGGNDIPKNAC